MAVITFYMSDRDPEQRMFKSKKEADEHDKKLELAESLSVFIGQKVEAVSEEMAEAIGMLIAEHRDKIMVALKGKPQVLCEAEDKLDTNDQTKQSDNSIADEKVVSLN